MDMQRDECHVVTESSYYTHPVHRGASLVGYDDSQYVREEERRVERKPQTARERAVLLLRATLLPGWQLTAGQTLVWVIKGAIVLGAIVLLASAVDKTL